MLDENGSSPNADTAPSAPAFDLVAQIVRMLESLPQESQEHVLQTVTTWLRLGGQKASRTYANQSEEAPSPSLAPHPQHDYPFSERQEVSPKEFLLEKDLHTDVERLAVLGYYLTHFRGQPHFKTEDLSKLNTEAAQRKFSNAAFTAKNAVRDGFFVAAPKSGLRQLSALGEHYVQALPDHEAARLLRKRMSRRRQRLASTSKRGAMVDGTKAHA